jgi:putative transcriptional regulator
VSNLRVFAGYAGWESGQLEGEIREGAWFVVDSFSSDPFAVEPSQLWQEVLRRQGGDLALVATFPEDPTLN